MEVRTSAADWVRIRVGVYILLIEDRLGVKPPHGFLALDDGTRLRIEKHVWAAVDVLKLAWRMRALKARLVKTIAVQPMNVQYPPCSMLGLPAIFNNGMVFKAN